MVHFNDVKGGSRTYKASSKKNPEPIGKTRTKTGPSSATWKTGQYAQGYDLPTTRGGILLETIPCPICQNSKPFIQHDARVELHWVGGFGYIKHVCCDKAGIWWRQI